MSKNAALFLLAVFGAAVVGAFINDYATRSTGVPPPFSSVSATDIERGEKIDAILIRLNLTHESEDPSVFKSYTEESSVGFSTDGEDFSTTAIDGVNLKRLNDALEELREGAFASVTDSMEFQWKAPPVGDTYWILVVLSNGSPGTETKLYEVTAK
ncbi:MAG: hypothetical protein CMJ83_00315 [Planctomycetes bacterium]|nr:hypothetical protein [Planctomycetota bacterium]